MTDADKSFLKSTWYSPRLGCEATLARWGTFGQPVLVFPTAGGDAEEIERFLMIKALAPLIEAGRIRIEPPPEAAAVAVDSATSTGRTWNETAEGSARAEARRRLWLRTSREARVTSRA